MYTGLPLTDWAHGQAPYRPRFYKRPIVVSSPSAKGPDTGTYEELSEGGEGKSSPGTSVGSGLGSRGVPREAMHPRTMDFRGTSGRGRRALGFFLSSLPYLSISFLRNSECRGASRCSPSPNLSPFLPPISSLAASLHSHGPATRELPHLLWPWLPPSSGPAAVP